MRRATLIGTLIATMVVFGLMLVPVVGASRDSAPAFQTSTETPTTGAATAEPTTAATAEATAEATTAATAEATTAATAEATTAATSAATKAPSTLPTTGGDSGMGMILLGAAVLLIMGAAVAMLVANRRGMQQ
jgi:LPXTG-motif cell wall-anchored protein